MNEDAPSAQTSGRSASEQVLALAAQKHEVIDSTGRRIVLKRPEPLTEFRFVELLGQSASNMTWLNMVMPLIFIVRIDDDDCPPFARKSEVDAMIQRLGRPGLLAVASGIKKHFPELAEDADQEAVKG